MVNNSRAKLAILVNKVIQIVLRQLWPCLFRSFDLGHCLLTHQVVDHAHKPELVRDWQFLRPAEPVDFVLRIMHAPYVKDIGFNYTNSKSNSIKS